MNALHKNPMANETTGRAVSGVPTWKRLLDITCVLLALPALVPLAVFIGISIKLYSSGPIMFSQARVGYRGTRFKCLKFRSMKINAHSSMHEKHLSQLINSDLPMTKMDSRGDPRIIPFGTMLRATGLDELPQIINVVRGEMSLVGPRPCLPYEHEKYLPRHKQRYDTLPGLTGLWQVSGKNKTTFEEMIEMDIWYATNKSFWLDLTIMLKTIPAIFGQIHETWHNVKQNSRSRTLATQPIGKSN